MATLKQFEEALRAQGMNMALAILEKMRKEEKKTRSVGVTSPRKKEGRWKPAAEVREKCPEDHPRGRSPG